MADVNRKFKRGTRVRVVNTESAFYGDEGKVVREADVKDAGSINILMDNLAIGGPVNFDKKEIELA